MKLRRCPAGKASSSGDADPKLLDRQVLHACTLQERGPTRLGAHVAHCLCRPSGVTVRMCRPSCLLPKIAAGWPHIRCTKPPGACACCWLSVSLSHTHTHARARIFLAMSESEAAVNDLDVAAAWAAADVAANEALVQVHDPEIAAGSVPKSHLIAAAHRLAPDIERVVQEMAAAGEPVAGPHMQAALAELGSDASDSSDSDSDSSSAAGAAVGLGADDGSDAGSECSSDEGDEAGLAAGAERDDDDGPAMPPRTEHELAPSEVQALATAVPQDAPVLPAGTVMHASLNEGSVVIAADPSAGPLAEQSVLVLDNKAIVGQVDEVFGSVTAPMYVVRLLPAQITGTPTSAGIVNVPMGTGERLAFAGSGVIQLQAQAAAAPAPAPSTGQAGGESAAAAFGQYGDSDSEDETGPAAAEALPVPSGTLAYAHISTVTAGKPVLAVVPLAARVQVDACRVRGSDASNAHNEEPAADELDYSDDEAEQLARRARRAAARAAAGHGPAKSASQTADAPAAATAGALARNTTRRGTRRGKRKQSGPSSLPADMLAAAQAAAHAQAPPAPAVQHTGAPAGVHPYAAAAMVGTAGMGPGPSGLIPGLAAPSNAPMHPHVGQLHHTIASQQAAMFAMSAQLHNMQIQLQAAQAAAARATQAAGAEAATPASQPDSQAPASPGTSQPPPHKPA